MAEKAQESTEPMESLYSKADMIDGARGLLGVAPHVAAGAMALATEEKDLWSPTEVAALVETFSARIPGGAQ